MTRVGFAGLGRMGEPMAMNVARAGFDLLLWNRNAGKADSIAAETNAPVVATPRQLAESSDVVISMLADDEASEQVHFGDDGLLAASSGASLFIEMGTISPHHLRHLASESGGRVVLDAPVSGSIDAARDGRLAIMVGADRSSVGSVEPLLLSIGRDVIFMGRAGAGAAMKLAVNLLIHGLNQTLAEALTLAEAAGISTEDAYKVVEGSAAAAPMLSYRKSNYLNEAESPVSFALNLARKDVELALGLAEELGVDMPQARVNHQMLQAAEAAGFGGRDMAALLAYKRGLV